MNENAAVKLLLDPKDKSEKKFLKIRVTYNRRPQVYSTGCNIRLSQKEFDNNKLKITKEAKEASARALNIAQSIVNQMGTSFSFKEFRKQYKERLIGKAKDTSLFSAIAEDYFNHRDLAPKTKQSYKTACKWLDSFHPKSRLEDINAVFIKDLVSYIRKENQKKDIETSPNTIGMYLRNLRCIYNYGIEKNGLENKKPFKDINTTSRRRQNYSLSEEELKKFIEYSPANNAEQFGKDFFLLSLLLSGANIGDILRLKNKNIKNDILTFQRKKTIKAAIEIKLSLTKSAKSLLKKYGTIAPSNPNDYILPYLTTCETESAVENKIHYIIKKINKGLAFISDALGISHMTTYVARHTFATLSVGTLDIVEIQKNLGHASSKTSASYIDSITTKTINKTKEFLEKITRTGS